MKNKIVKFKKWDCIVKYSRYQHDNSTAIQLIDATLEDLVSIPTVVLDKGNFPQVESLKGPLEVYIKDYSENTGAVQALESAGIIKATTTKYDINGFGSMVIKCKIIDPYFKIEE